MRIVIPYTKRFLSLPNQNFRTLMDGFMSYGRARDINIRCINENDILQYNDFDILLSLRTFGLQSEQVIQHYRRHGIRIVVWHDDIHRYWLRFAVASKRIAFVMEIADLVFLVYCNQAAKYWLYRKHMHKCVWMPWSVPDRYFDYPTTPWQERKDAILLSGRISRQYKLRNRIYEYISRHENLNVDILEHPSYDVKNPLHRIIGIAFIEFLASYKYAIATTAYDYTVAKYMEIPAAGCLLIAEPTSDLPQLGFRDGENCIMIARDNYKETLCRRELLGDERMARRGYDLVRNNHVHSLRIMKMMDIMSDWYANSIRRKSSRW